jgi:hypothetical protein
MSQPETRPYDAWVAQTYYATDRAPRTAAPGRDADVPSPRITIRTVDDVSHQSRVTHTSDWLASSLAGLAIPALMVLTVVLAHLRGFGFGS